MYTLRLARMDELPIAVEIDDAAGALYAQAGLAIALAPDHPFVVAEQARWRSAIEHGQLWFGCAGAQPVGFGALGRVGGLAYLEQLAVRPEHGRRGLGALLLAAACEHAERAGEAELWLTTYAHLPWNGPYYERHGFSLVPESRCSPELQAVLAEQRAALPDPSQRIAMVRKLR